eukprot:TRINITY_DN12834_c0_g1_i2.p1 TRINITY_DN12834_c0_g1~~TRINITY_DN12834_c0_g1_i2.p1  ORF type:complete len:123 (-),score=20.65 TRINITY_DN12834_c0_g1_i2:494-862(-)
MVFDAVEEEVWPLGGNFCKWGSGQTQSLEGEELGFEGSVHLAARSLGCLEMAFLMWVSLKPLCLTNLRTDSGFSGDLMRVRVLEARSALSIDNPHFCMRKSTMKWVCAGDAAVENVTRVFAE